MTSFFLHLQFANFVNVEYKIININQLPATAEQRFPQGAPTIPVLDSP